MTLKARNALVLLMTLLVTILLVTCVLAIFSVKPQAPLFKDLLSHASGRYFQLSWPLSKGEIQAAFISSGLSLFVAISMAILFLAMFRRISSPELFFIFLFWATMAFEVAKVINLWCIQTGLGMHFETLISRIYYCGRLTGALCLFAASLHLAGVKLQYQGTLLILILGISATCALVIPIDTTTRCQGLLYLSSSDVSPDVLNVLIGILSLLNLAKFSLSSKKSRDLLITIPFSLLIVGHEFLFVAANTSMVVVAWIFLTSGTVWLCRRFVRSFLWY